MARHRFEHPEPYKPKEEKTVQETKVEEVTPEVVLSPREAFEQKLGGGFENAEVGQRQNSLYRTYTNDTECFVYRLVDMRATRAGSWEELEREWRL